MINQQNRLYKLLGLNLFFVVILFLLGLNGITNGSIFSNFTSNKYSLYSVLTILGLVIIDILFIIEVYARKGDKLYGDSVLAVSQGELPATEMFKNTSNRTLLFGTISVFSLVSMVIFWTKGTMGKIAQTQTPMLDMFLILMENVMLATCIALVVVLFRWIARKNNWTMQRFRSMTWLNVLVMAIAFGYLLHKFSKDGNIDALNYSMVFWGATAFVTLVSGSLFIGLGGHFLIDFPFFMNNIMAGKYVVIVYGLIAFGSGYLALRTKSRNIAFDNKTQSENGFTDIQAIPK